MFYNLTLLSGCKLFENIPLNDIPKSIKCLRGYDKSFKNEETVYISGKQDFLPGVVLSGSLQVYQIFPDGSQILIRTVQPGELFGVSIGYEDDENTFICSNGDSSILFLHLPGRNYTNDCNCQYRMIILENLIAILAKNNKYLNNKIQILSRPNLRDKLLMFIRSQQPSGQNNKKKPMTREEIAQFICADRSAVSRELSRMKDDGIILLEGKNILLKE